MGWNLRLEASHVNNHIPRNNLIWGYSFSLNLENGWDSEKVETPQDIKRLFKNASQSPMRFYINRPASGGGYGFMDFNLNLFSLPKDHKDFPEKLNIYMYENDGQNAVGVATLYGLRLTLQKLYDVDKALTAFGNKFLTAKESKSFRIFTFIWHGKYNLNI